jgi:DnaJ domain
MFERNPVDTKAETMVAVEVSLVDGSKIAGRAVLAPGKGVHKLLDGTDAFIYVDGFDGEGAFVPKSDIRGLKVIQPGKPTALSLGVPDARTFDPYRVLGLTKGATFEEIRAAYHQLTKMYHPDRYASIELPREVAAYVNAMAKNVNAAFRALRYIGDKQPAIYTRGS